MDRPVITKRRYRSAMPFVVAFCFAGSIMVPALGADNDQSTGGVSDEEFQLPLDDKAAEEVDELIEQLGSPVYREREAASTRLTEIGAPAFAKLRLAYRQTDDIEVRLRIEALVHQGYFDYRVYGRNGFLGIQQAPEAITATDDARIDEGQLGIRINSIISGTGAAKAGIKKDDIIIQLNGEPLPVEGGLPADAVAAPLRALGQAVDQPWVAFGERLRVLGPGTRIELRVLRGSKTLEIEATLGRRPKRYYGGRTIAGAILREASGDFESWWVYHFRPQHTSGGGD